MPGACPVAAFAASVSFWYNKDGKCPYRTTVLGLCKCVCGCIFIYNHHLIINATSAISCHDDIFR